MREKKDCCGGGGFFSIDFPGVGIVTAEDEGDGEEDISSSSLASATSGQVMGRLIADAQRPSADRLPREKGAQVIIFRRYQGK